MPSKDFQPLIPTQDDVAAAAGVSRSTVSRALRNHPSIPGVTRERIVALASQMGYRENPFVSANMQRVRGSSKVGSQASIAFITPCELSAWYREVPSYERIYDSARQRCAELGFDLDPISLLDQKLTGKRCSDILIARGIDGVLIAPFDNPYARLRLDWGRFSVATIGFAHVEPRFSYAACNHFYNISLLLRRLHRLGYRRIGLAMPARANRYAQGAFQAAYLLHVENHASDARIPKLTPQHLSDWNPRNFLAWFYENRPDAIVCINHEMWEWLEAEKIRVPDDVGLAILSRHDGEDEWCGIHQHTEHVGRAAVQIVADQLMLNQRGSMTYPRAILVEGEWGMGKSVRRQHRAVEAVPSG